MRLDLGGIAMGYAVDEGLKVLLAHGIQSAMIDASGDVGALRAPPGTRGWRIGIVPLEPSAPPSRYLLLENGAVTTSGDAYQFVEIGGKRYSHIVDPRTGIGVTTPSAATVFAPTCIAADSLATALSVMGPEKGLALIDNTPGAAAVYLTNDNGQPVARESCRWKTLQFAEP
jgi:thiamine biosynthesis lipoprotein